MQKELKQQNEALIGGTIIYFIGNVLTQLISIVLLKYITGSVSTEGYGYFSLVVTIDNLITPMITLQISDAVFRFIIRAKDVNEVKDVYSSGTIVIVIGAIITCLLICVIKNIFDIKYTFWIGVYIVSTNIFGYIQRVTRSLGKNRIFVTANLVKSGLYFLFIVVFVLHYQLGVKGLFISNSVSTYICVILLIFKTQLYKYFELHRVNASYIKEMVRFSAPLIPNTAIWWMQSSVNSIIITSFIGLKYNGIYSVAIKFASILHLVINVFDLAWQESAMREYGNKYYKMFITQTFNRYLIFLMSCLAILIPTLKIFTPFLIDNSYKEAVPYIPFLLCSTALSACTGFFAQIITAKNKNVKLLKTNFIGAVSNIIIVFSLINILGIWAVVLSVVITNIVLVFSRFKIVKEDFELENINKGKIIFLVVVNVCSCLTFFSESNLWLFGMLFVITIFSIYINIDLIKEIMALVKRKMSF